MLKFNVTIHIENIENIDVKISDILKAVKNVVERALNGERNRAITAMAAAKAKKDGSKLSKDERETLTATLDAAGLLPESTKVEKDAVKVDLVK